MQSKIIRVVAGDEYTKPVDILDGLTNGAKPTRDATNTTGDPDRWDISGHGTGISEIARNIGNKIGKTDDTTLRTIQNIVKKHGNGDDTINNIGVLAAFNEAKTALGNAVAAGDGTGAWNIDRDSQGGPSALAKNLSEEMHKDAGIIQDKLEYLSADKHTVTNDQIAQVRTWCMRDDLGNPDSYRKLNQQSYGNCWEVAGLVSLGQTDWGRQQMQNSIHANADGTYTVVFPNDTNHHEHIVRPDQWQNSRIMSSDGSYPNNAIRIIAAAMLQDHNPMAGSALQTVADLFTDNGEHAVQLSDTTYSSDDQAAYQDRYNCLQTINGGSRNGRITNINATFSANCASAVDQALFQIGGPNALTLQAAGSATTRTHAFTLLAIDWEKGIIEYCNPWNSSKTLTMPIDQFCKMKGVLSYLASVSRVSDPVDDYMTPEETQQEIEDNEDHDIAETGNS